MKRAFLCFILGVSLLGVGAASAAPPPPPSPPQQQLKGQYAVTGSWRAINAAEFDENNFSALAPSWFTCSSYQGVANFNGDGTGTVEGTGVATSLSFNAEMPGLSGKGQDYDYSYDFTYTVDPDGTITISSKNDKGKIFTGSEPEEYVTFNIENESPVSGRASFDNGVLTLSTKTTGIETITTTTITGEENTSHRIKHKSAVFIYLGPASR